jgi:DNA-binding GntR family transcriptional regulator
MVLVATSARCEEIGQFLRPIMSGRPQELIAEELTVSSMAEPVITTTARSFTRGRTLKAQITDAIRAEILSGRYPLGAKLNEKSLQNEFAVSRTPIREALLNLQTEGLIVIKPQSGTFVFSPTAEDVHNLCELRSILEVGAIRLAVAPGRMELVAELQGIITEATQRLASGQLEKCLLLDTRFHRAFVDSCGNPLLIDAYQVVSDRIHALRQIMPLTKRRVTVGFAGHREILKAVKKGDANLAAILIRRHVQGVEELLLERLKST